MLQRQAAVSVGQQRLQSRRRRGQRRGQRMQAGMVDIVWIVRGVDGDGAGQGAGTHVCRRVGGGSQPTGTLEILYQEAGCNGMQEQG